MMSRQKTRRSMPSSSTQMFTRQAFHRKASSLLKNLESGAFSSFCRLLGLGGRGVLVRDQLLVGELVRIDRLELPVSVDRDRLDRLVPIAKLRLPEVPLEDLFRALEALRDLVLRDRLHCPVCE